MKRLALILATAAILSFTAGAAQAHSYHHGHGYDHGHHDYHGGVVVVRPAPVVVRPSVVYPPVYRYGYYDPCPAFDFHYRGPRVSVGVGF